MELFNLIFIWDQLYKSLKQIDIYISLLFFKNKKKISFPTYLNSTKLPLIAPNNLAFLLSARCNALPL